MSTLSTVQQWLGDQIIPVFFIGFAILMGIAMVYFSAKSRRVAGAGPFWDYRRDICGLAVRVWL